MKNMQGLAKKLMCSLSVMALFVSITPTQATAASIEARGIAPIESGGLDLARIAAIRDATLQAEMQAGSVLEAGESTAKSGTPLQSSRLRAKQNFGEITVLREWVEGDMFHVLIRADEKSLRDQVGVGRAYRKKVVAGQFILTKPLQAPDFEDLWNGVPRELMQRLESSGQVLPRLIQRPVLTDALQVNTEALRKSMQQVAEQSDAQFIISGFIVDMGSALEGGYFGYLQDVKRRFEVELFIHDGMTGAMLSHHRLDKWGIAKSRVEPGKPFGSAAFYMTDYGKVINDVINDMVSVVLADLSRLPFAAKVVRVNGNKIFIDAGATSSIGVGDKLVVYQLQPGWGISALQNGADIGIPETPITTVLITQVQPLFSTGELQTEMKNNKVRIGDLVRFETPR